MKRNFVTTRAGSVVKQVIAHVSIILFFACVPALVFGADRNQKPVRVDDVHYSASGGRVVVDYTLIGNEDNQYMVRLILKRGTDSSFEYSPRAVSGDVGSGIYVGMNKRIVWAVDEDFPQGLRGSDYYFVVQAQEIKKTSGGKSSMITMIGGGAALLAGATFYVLFSSQKHSSPSAVTSFPTPPGRP